MATDKSAYCAVTPNAAPYVNKPGLQIWENPKNGFHVAALHFTADPAKNNANWIAEQRASTSPEAFDREYNINFNAMSGAATFPQIMEHRSKIIVEPPFPDVSPMQPCWAGMDWGAVNPSSFEVMTWSENADGEPCIDTIWELYEPAKSPANFAQKVMDNCPYYAQINSIWSDPRSVWGPNRTGSDGPTIAQLLLDAGFDKIVPGQTSENTWISLMANAWRDLDIREPTYRIWKCCPNLIDEFEKARFQKLSARMLENSNPSDKMVDKHNHAMDAVKMGMLSTVPITKSIERGRHKSKTLPHWKRYMA